MVSSGIKRYTLSASTSFTVNCFVEFSHSGNQLAVALNCRLSWSSKLIITAALKFSGGSISGYQNQKIIHLDELSQNEYFYTLWIVGHLSKVSNRTDGIRSQRPVLTFNSDILKERDA